MTEQQTITDTGPRGAGSFCIPRVVLEALLDAQANVYEICAYLVLARFTEGTGRYSTASISAINRYTGANKVKGGPVHRAIERLKTIRASRKVQVSNGRSGKSYAMVAQHQDLGPILFERDTWHIKTGEILPDGPIPRGKVLYVLPDFGEALDERIWFGGNLVTGIRQFDQPLKALKHAGDAAARLLLLLYAGNDMETWGGVRPVGDGRGPWEHYEPVDGDKPLNGGARLIRAKRVGPVAAIDARIGDTEAYWSGLRALQSTGLIYEMVLVLNRNAQKAKFGGGGEYGAIADDAEPYYDLDCRSKHGYKPEGEEGISGATANTAGRLGFPVTIRDERQGDIDNAVTARASAQFDGTYAAIVPEGYPAMIAGIYRLRFRVSNPKNAGVKGTWARIHQNNREVFDFVQAVRAANDLDPLVAPWEPRKVPAPATAKAEVE